MSAISNLLSYAKDQGFLPGDHPGLKGVPNFKKADSTVQTFTVEEMTKLLNASEPEVLVPMALTAFAGIRAEELKRLDWQDVKLERGFIEIKAAVAKTKVRRLSPLSENLRAGLLPFRKSSGPLVVYKKLCWQYTKLPIL